jgi:hypothetical protein
MKHSLGDTLKFLFSLGSGKYLYQPIKLNKLNKATSLLQFKTLNFVTCHLISIQSITAV